MSPSTHQFLSIDLPPILTALFASIACALLGNFLVLRRIALMGDAISHAVLPGLVISFLITGTRHPLPMLLGAALAGLATVATVEVIRKLGRLEPGAAMGVTFSVFFALGVLLLEQAAARQVDLDPDCVLHGMLETIFWFPPADWPNLLSPETLTQLPRQVITTASMAIIAILFVTLFFKELRLAAFDPDLATSLGFSATRLNALLMALVAAATVAAFEAVGSILVIAMLICPAATARLLTDRLRTQLALSAAVAAVTSIGGYILGAFAPQWLGFHNSLSTTGTMTAIAGVILALVVVASPTQGVLAKAARRLRLAADIAREDALGILYRLEESAARDTQPRTAPANSQADERHLAIPLAQLRRAIAPPIPARLAIRDARRRNEITVIGSRTALTPLGRRAAAAIIRSHRLWESYLVDEAGLQPDHVHDTAMRLEHVRTREPLNSPRTSDPQGRNIPDSQDP